MICEVQVEVPAEAAVFCNSYRQEGAWRGTKRRRGGPLAEPQDGTPDGIEEDGEKTVRYLYIGLSHRNLSYLGIHLERAGFLMIWFSSSRGN